MLKDFGVILTIEYTSSTIFLVKVKNRDDSSAAQIVSGTVLKSERTLVAEEFVDAINITSVDSRESYKKQIFATKINEFSHTGDFVVQFFGTGLERSFDALQGNELVGYRYDYSFPLGSYIFYWGSSLITPIWTVGAGVSSRSTVWGTIYEFDLSSSATRSMSQDFALTNENLMFKCLLGFEGTANAGSTFVLTMTLKDSTGAAVTTFTMPLTYAQLNLLSSSSSIIGAGFKLSVLFGVPVNEAIFLKTITVQIQAIGITSGNLRMAMVNWGVYRNEESVARFLGRKIYNLFTKIRSKYIRSFSGISIGNVGDYFDAEGLRYYAKLIEKDYYNDETNIEAINYQ